MATLTGNGTAVPRRAPGTVSQTVLVAGATGYVGGRLIAELNAAGKVRVRCLARTPAKLDAAPWRSNVEVVRGSVGGDLGEALKGVDTIVYLVHSIGQGEDWAQRELVDARNVAEHARAAGVSRIVYLGGLGRDGEDLSPHLRSRHEVGRALAASGIPTIELRAGVIIGSGSASFEMLRYLVEVLPVMVTPRWVATRCQPIAIADVVAYLQRAVVQSRVPPGVYEIGSPDVVSYAGLMDLYARAAGLPKRKLISVPVLTPSLSSHWVGLVTPVPVPLARELVESLVNEVVVDDDRAGATFGVRAMGLADGIRRALAAVERANVPTTWSGADLVHFAPVATDPEWSGGTSLSDVRHATTLASLEAVYDTIAAIGGERGWYSGEILWQIRGVLDKVVGGPGLRKGRKRTIAVGDTIDFWRVEDLRPGRRVRLRAEMVLPGRAWLTWDLEPEGSGTRVSQTATFRPRGLWGRAYWLAVAPFHRFVFPGMLAGIVGEAESRAPSGSKVGPPGTPPHLDRHGRSKLTASSRRSRVVRRSVPTRRPSRRRRSARRRSARPDGAR
jgi:uncharacterized protein YbjT (DUF2867 family)